MPILKESDFKKHIASKQFSNLYFIDGEEKMLVGMYTDTLIKKLMGDNPPEFNYHVFDSECDISDVSVSCAVVPFMCDKNCVKIVDLDIDDMLTEDVDALANIAKNIADTTVLILTMTTLQPPAKVSKSSRKSKIYLRKTASSQTFADAVSSHLKKLFANGLMTAALRLVHSQHLS